VPKARRNTMKDVEIEGSLPGTSAAAGAREEYTLRSVTEKLPQVLKEMEFFQSLFYSFYLHDFGRTASPPRSYGIMRGACLVGMSFPGGDDMRVQFYLVVDNVVPYQSSPPLPAGEQVILVLCLWAERSSHSLSWARGLPVCTWGLIVLTRNSACFFVHPKIIKNIFREIRYIVVATLARRRQPAVAGLFY